MLLRLPLSRNSRSPPTWGNSIWNSSQAKKIYTRNKRRAGVECAPERPGKHRRTACRATQPKNKQVSTPQGDRREAIKKKESGDQLQRETRVAATWDLRPDPNLDFRHGSLEKPNFDGGINYNRRILPSNVDEKMNPAPKRTRTRKSANGRRKTTHRAPRPRDREIEREGGRPRTGTRSVKSCFDRVKPTCAIRC